MGIRRLVILKLMFINQFIERTIRGNKSGIRIQEKLNQKIFKIENENRNLNYKINKIKIKK